MSVCCCYLVIFVQPGPCDPRNCIFTPVSPPQPSEEELGFMASATNSVAGFFGGGGEKKEKNVLQYMHGAEVLVQVVCNDSSGNELAEIEMERFEAWILFGETGHSHHEPCIVTNLDKDGSMEVRLSPCHSWDRCLIVVQTIRNFNKSLLCCSGRSTSNVAIWDVVCSMLELTIWMCAAHHSP